MICIILPFCEYLVFYFYLISIKIVTIQFSDEHIFFILFTSCCVVVDDISLSGHVSIVSFFCNFIFEYFSVQFFIIWLFDTQTRLGYIFWEILSKCFPKKGRNPLSCLKLFGCPLKFNNFQAFIFYIFLLCYFALNILFVFTCS